jgi:hypothetical protein
VRRADAYLREVQLDASCAPSLLLQLMREGSGSVWEVFLQVLVQHKPHMLGLILRKKTTDDGLRDAVVRHGGHTNWRCACWSGGLRRCIG